MAGQVFLFVLAGMALMLLLWASVRELLVVHVEKLREIREPKLEQAVKAMFFVPLAAAIISAAILWYVFATDFQNRAIHALLLLSLWCMLLLLLLAFYLRRRLNMPYAKTAIAGLVVAVFSIIYLTPWGNFQALFNNLGYDRALIMGIAILSMWYMILRRFRRIFH